jgi:chromate transport protein ChrA
MDWNKKYVLLVVILVSSLVSITLNGIVTIAVLIIGGFIFWIFSVAKKNKNQHVSHSEIKSL